MLNDKKAYAFVPTPVGPVKLQTRSSTRSRLSAGGTYFRSIERGQSANAIQLTIVIEGTAVSGKGVFVEHHTALKPSENLVVIGMAIPKIDLYSLELPWNAQLRFELLDGELRLRLYALRWQDGTFSLQSDLGKVQRIVNIPGLIGARLGTTAADWTAGAVLIVQPRTHRYALVTSVVTDQDTHISTSRWDPSALRSSVSGVSPWITMPARAPAPSDPPVGLPLRGEDVQDAGQDSDTLSAFGPMNMTGGDGLPNAPVGINTGPDRALVHLNYAEKDDGSMGEFNQVFEWVGDSATIGSWQRYS